MSTNEFGDRTYQRIPDGLQTPVCSAYQTFVESTTFEREFVSTFFDSRTEYDRLTSEYYDRQIDVELENAREKHAELTDHGRVTGLNKFTPDRLYALVRKRRPRTILETGVYNDVSALVLLRALEQNKQGILHSIGLPDDRKLPEDRDHEWIVPGELHGRWTLASVNLSSALPHVLEDVDVLDVFIPDPTTRILQELSIVWPHMSSTGVIFVGGLHCDQMIDKIEGSFPVEGGYVAPSDAFFKSHPENGPSHEYHP